MARRAPGQIGYAAVAAVGGAAVLAGLAATWLVLESNREPHPEATAALNLAVALAYVASGLVAWRQRPENRLGPLMVFVGFAAFAAFLEDSSRPWPFTFGSAFQNVYLAGFLFLMLSFPTGRLGTHLDRALVGVAAALCLVLSPVIVLFAAPGSSLCGDCPRNVFLVDRNGQLADGLLFVLRGTGAVLSLFVAGLLVARWRRATPAARRSVAPVLLAGSALFAVLVISILNDILDDSLGGGPDRALALVIAATPVAVVTVLLRRKLARGAVAGLVVELGEQPRRTGLRDALARALDDPHLELAYWLAAGGRYVDGDGHLVELPGPGDTRATTLINRGGEPIAALVHDPALREHAELIDSVCAAAALALENERLQAELRARLDDLRRSRARIVEATANERRRIERDLHDGTQQRLVAIAWTLGLAESKLAREPAAVAPVLREAREGLLQTLADLRGLSQGIHPSLLTERGLGEALRDLASRGSLPVQVRVDLDRRLPVHVEAAAYFVVSESLANAEKHSHATECRVAAEDTGATLLVSVHDDGIGGAAAGGSGLRGLADRVEALGGRFTLSSPPGRGTTVEVRIPCE